MDAKKPKPDAVPQVEEPQMTPPAVSQTSVSEAEEIDKIMNEIKELQQEIETEEPAVRSEVIHLSNVPAKATPAQSDRSLEKSHSEALPKDFAVKTDTDRNSDDEPTGQLSMFIHDDLTLRLNYGGDLYVLVCFQDEDLVFRLSNGTEFRFPAQKKAA